MQTTPRVDAEHEVTAILRAWGHGEAEAVDRLMPIVYDELRRQARRFLRNEDCGHTLETNALVHEAFLRLLGQRTIHWENRAQFFGIAAQLMRRILVDHARAQRAEKRGGMVTTVALDAGMPIALPGNVDIVALNDALDRLAALHPRQARVVELRYFAGLGIEETAEALGVSIGPVKRDWAVARAWLRRELTDMP